MNIREFTFNLQKVYEEISDTFSSFQKQSGLSCLKECGRCCTSPTVEASTYEMIPMALAIYDNGTAEEWILRLEENSTSTCMAFIPDSQTGNGKCSLYHYRPSVCRMFGAAAVLDKYQRPTLSVCKYIKEQGQEIPNFISEKAPSIPEWTFKLHALDPALLEKKQPINLALLHALQKIVLYAQYQSL